MEASHSNHEPVTLGGQKPLNIFNEKIDWIKLTAVSGKPNELIVEFIFKDNIPIDALWFLGWGVARSFVAALNLATMGFWWWHLPKDIDSYYESIEDVETKARIEIKRNPSLRIDWGGNRVLSDEDITRFVFCFISFPPPQDRERHKPYDYYIGGLTFLSINDVHWQCEMQAFGNFLEGLRAMMEKFGELQRGDSMLPLFDAFTAEMMPELPDKAKLMDMVAAFERKAHDSVVVSLQEVAFLKLICDTYYQHRILKRAAKEIAVHT